MEKLQRKELISSWLKLFGNSALFFLPDIRNTRGPDWSKNHSFDRYINTNDEIPYGLFFTPCGNFWKINREGEKLVRTQTTAEAYIPALFFDLDLKGTDTPDISSVDELFDKTVQIIKERNLPVHFLTKSGGGVHGYLMIEETSRGLVGQIGKFQQILETIADMFPGGDHNRLTIEKLMRVPFGNHWKTGLPIEVQLFRLNKTGTANGIEIEPELVTTPSGLEIPSEELLSYEHVKHMADSITETVDSRKTLGIQITWAINNDINVVNKLPIQNVFDRLVKYPRPGTHAGKEVLTTYRYDKTHIYFEHVDKTTGEVCTEGTMGYRINITENYVHNFSTQSHDIKDRPRGPVYPFLFHYFNRDRNLIKEFLRNEFHIELMEETSDTLMPTIISSKGQIVFTKKGVIYKKENIDNKGKPVRTEVILFDGPILIKGVIESAFSTRGELPKPVKNYIIHRPDAFQDKDLIIEFRENRSRFNAQYGRYGLIFKGSEEDLLDFYLAINNAVNAGQVDRHELLYLNGFYKDFFLLGGTFITKDFQIKKSWDKVILETPPVNLAMENKNHISMKEFGKKLRWLFSDRVAIVGFLAFIAEYLGTRYWAPLEKVKQQLMLPALIFSGITQAGKSTLIIIMKEGAGLHAKSRLVSANGTTPQPLKQAGTDSFLLHIEEFTGMVSREKESIIRDIINRAQTSRGTLSWDNINYNYRSSIVLDGERLPSGRSVVNRAIVIPMFPKEQRGNETSLREIRRGIYLKELITKAYDATEEKLVAIYLESEESLSPIMSGRQLMLYSYLLTVNKIYDIFPEEDVISAITENLSVMEGVLKENDELSSLLADLLITRRIVGRKRKADWNSEDYKVEIPVPTEVLSEKQIDIVSCLKAYPSKIKFSNHNLIVDVKQEDEELFSRMSPFEQYLKIIS